MKKIHNDYFDETYYIDTLDNGLRVVIFQKPDFLSTVCSFGTNFGDMNVNQKVGDKNYSFNPGIAHFLEHKLFECEDKDIFNKFSLLGCNVNAFTSYSETVYYFSTTSKDIDEPLNLLLDFVQSLEITDKSVEKEKGIIIQELSTYLQNADARLQDEGNKSLFINHPYKNTLGGNSDTVSNITRKELYDCYNINYHPSNMALVIVSPIEPEHLINVVRNNQSKKTFANFIKPINTFDDEPLYVKRKDYSFTMNINNPKQLYSIKLKPNFNDINDCLIKEWCMNIYLKIYFSNVNPNYQKWIDEGKINSYFDYDVDFSLDHATIAFFNESNENNLKELVDSELKKDLINEELLKQIKRRYVGSSFMNFNEPELFCTSYIRDYLKGIDYFDGINMLMNLSLNDLIDTYNSFDYSNYSIINILPSSK